MIYLKNRVDDKENLSKSSKNIYQFQELLLICRPCPIFRTPFLFASQSNFFWYLDLLVLFSAYMRLGGLLGRLMQLDSLKRRQNRLFTTHFH